VKLALIGDPVEHSRSPKIHERFLRGAGIEGSYEAIRVRLGTSAREIQRLRREGYNGCNVTSPLKEEVAGACDVLTPQAERVGAVNTIAFRARIIGTNTDGIGAVEALRTILKTLHERRIAVLGTGPTARSAIAALQEEEAEPLAWGRDTAKVTSLSTRYNVVTWNTEELTPDAVFSALVPGAELPQRLLDALSRVRTIVDANYGDRSTLGTQLGFPVIDGSGMLEAQARASFEFWLSK
jgi:shikimate dehydrogenase